METEPDFGLKENDDGTFTLTLYSLDLNAAPTTYAVITASAHDTIYNILHNILSFPPPQ